LWNIVLDRPVTGQLLLAISFEQKREDATDAVGKGGGHGRTGNKIARAIKDRVPRIPYSPCWLSHVARQTGYIAIEAASDQEGRAAGGESSVKSIRRNLPFPATWGGTSRAYCGRVSI